MVMKNTNKKYQLGYLPKIAYHIARGNEEKAISFSNSHIEKYGEIEVNELVLLLDLIKEEQERLAL
jgi:hypothetical protein